MLAHHLACPHAPCRASGTSRPLPAPCRPMYPPSPAPSPLPQVHWLHSKEQLPRVFFESGGKLCQRLAPGFCVRFFHYFRRPPSEGPGKVFPLEREWPHQETWALVRARRVRRAQSGPGARAGGPFRTRVGARGRLTVRSRAMCRLARCTAAIPCTPTVAARLLTPTRCTGAAHAAALSGAGPGACRRQPAAKGQARRVTRRGGAGTGVAGARRRCSRQRQRR